MTMFRIQNKRRTDHRIATQVPAGACSICHRPLSGDTTQGMHQSCADSASHAWRGRRK